MTREYPLERIRNIGIIAHIDAGKTTTTERILYYTGRTYKLGNVDEGTTVTDWMAQERERGITITAAAITCYWRDYQINIIDTPGHIDFTAEVQRSLRVLDGGVVIFDAVAGVEPQSETVWRQADRYNVPRVCYINKMDRIGADFQRAVNMIRERLQAHPLPIQLPIGSEQRFLGAVDLLTMQSVTWSQDDLGVRPDYGEIPVELRQEAEVAHKVLVERLVETDDDLMIKYLDGKEVTEDELRRALRQATLAGEVTPVLCGSSLRNKGVQPLLDAIVDYLPSPVEVPPIVGINPYTQKEETRKADEQEPVAALVFKIQTDPYVGRLAYFRIYSGHLQVGQSLLNATSGSKGRRERISRLLRMYADHREEIKEIHAGDIAATVGLKFSFTGETLCAAKAPIILESITFPEPVIQVAIEPKTTIDQEKMAEALERLAEEDPTFRVKVDENTGQTIISGMGELHLEVLVDRMLREFKVGANVGRPRVAYRETITRTVQGEGRFVRQSGGRGQYGHVILKLEPLESGAGFVFENQASEEQVPPEFVPAVERGVRESLESGVLAGYSLVDLKATLIGGSYDESDSTDVAFKVAASTALYDGASKADPVLLEPMMDVEIVTPDEFTGDVVASLNVRRAQIDGMELRPGSIQAIRGQVPLAEMFGYATHLRSMSQGRGTFTMEFDHYEQVDRQVAERIVYGGRY